MLILRTKCRCVILGGKRKARLAVGMLSFGRSADERSNDNTDIEKTMDPQSHTCHVFRSPLPLLPDTVDAGVIKDRVSDNLSSEARDWLVLTNVHSSNVVVAYIGSY